MDELFEEILEQNSCIHMYAVKDHKGTQFGAKTDIPNLTRSGRPTLEKALRDLLEALKEKKNENI